jgi:hypothetical protein
LADAGATPVSIALGVTSGSSATAGTYTVSARIFDAAAPAYWVSTNVIYQVANAGPVGAFSDDFNRADSSTLGNGWTLAAGGYAIQGGAAVGQVALNLAVKATVTGQTDSASAVFVRSTSASGIKFGVVVRYGAAAGYYVCYRQAGGASQWKISKMVNGVEKVLKAVSATQAPIATLFTVSCSVSGNVISIGDGSKVTASVIDTSLTSGAVGIWTDKGARVDSFSGSAQ